MQADERLQLHKAYTKAIQKQSNNCFTLTPDGRSAEKLIRGPKGGKVGRAMGDRWRRSTDHAPRITHNIAERTPLEEEHQWIARRDEVERGRRYRERVRENESRRKREEWEMKSTVAREVRKIAAQGTQNQPWTENDHSHQARHLLTQTLKDREKLFSQNDRLMGMAKEVEILSEKLRIAEGLVAKHQTKLKNQEMFMSNMEAALQGRVPADEHAAVVKENQKLMKSCQTLNNSLSASRIREQELKVQLNHITRMQMMEDEEVEDSDAVPTVAPPVISAVPQSAEPAMKVSKNPEPNRVSHALPGPDGDKIQQPRGKTISIEMPKKAYPISPTNIPLKPFPTQKIFDNPLNGRGDMIAGGNATGEGVTGNAVTLLQQYIRNLISENQQLKNTMATLEKPDLKKQLFPEFVSLKRENARMRKLLAKLGVDESSFKKKFKPRRKVESKGAL